jgi:adenylate cyclase
MIARFATTRRPIGFDLLRIGSLANIAPHMRHDCRMVDPQSGPLSSGGHRDEVYRLVGLERPSLERSDVEAVSGVDATRSVRWWRAMGFPEVVDGDVAFGPEDARVVRRLRDLTDAGIMSDDDVLRLARLMGNSFSRLVEAQLEVISEFLGTPGDGEVDDRDGRPRTAEVLEFVESSMIYVWRRHLLAALTRRFSIADTGGSLAVGFADLSGFSRITKKAGSEQIAEIIDTFEKTVFDVVSMREGRVVKLIGDEAMFVAESIDDAVAIAVDIIVRLEQRAAVPPVHCGLAFGPTTSVGGDAFGSTVNLASRLTDIARPNSIVVSRSDGERFLGRDDLDVRRVRRSQDLKGVGRTRIISIRPLVAEPEPLA